MGFDPSLTRVVMAAPLPTGARGCAESSGATTAMRDSWFPTDSADLRTRALQGGVALAVQRVVGILVTGIGGIILARLLMPELFGIYGIMSFAVGLGVTLASWDWARPAEA